MKKSIFKSLLVVVVLTAVAVSGSVFAQTPDPQDAAPTNGYQGQLVQDGFGIYHEEMMAAFSEALGIPVETLEARITAGETIVQIALDAGMTIEDIRALMPAGGFGQGGARMGRGQNGDGQFLYGDGTCMETGEYTPQYLQNQRGSSRGSRGGGRWGR